MFLSSLDNVDIAVHAMKLGAKDFILKKNVNQRKLKEAILAIVPPEPVADFFDAVVLGDGEEVILNIAAALRDAKATATKRREILHLLSRIDGVYIPLFFEPQYRGQQLTAVTPLVDDYSMVTRRVLPELPPVELLVNPLVPLVKPIHDRLGVEIARGCTRGQFAISGDVKYYLGTSMDRTYPDGRRIHLSLVANPSHLECETCDTLQQCFRRHPPSLVS